MTIKYPHKVLHTTIILGAVALLLIAFYFVEDTIQNLETSKAITPKELYELDFYNDEFPYYVQFSEANFKGEKLVHFDLKGAPPKVSYLLKFLPLIKRLGATGILIEYEDMFPYYDELEELAAMNAYSLSNISKILKEAEKNNLTVIPLVQTFGHMEFVLKLEKFRYYREVEDVPDVICPTHMDTPSLIYKMIDQVMSAHPSIQYFHMGCDEVYTVGACDKCQQHMKTYKWRRKNLYFDHVKRIAKYIIKTYPKVRPIIWGDEINKKNEKLIVYYKLPEVVDVMFWNYKTKVSSFPSPADMASYAKLFKSVWIASAFKGALNMDQIAVDPMYHLKNNKGWMHTVIKWKEKIHFKGIVLTGWQRFHHFSVLCELLPVAVPSLAINLHFLTKLNDVDHKTVQSVLGCNDYFPFYGIQNAELMSRLRCEFPGFRAYASITTYSITLEEIEVDLKFFKKVAFTFYSTAYNYTHPREVRNRIKVLNKHLLEIKNHELMIRESLKEVYDEHTITEWILTHIMPHEMRLESAAKLIDSMTDIKIWPRRPLQQSETYWRTFFHQVCSQTQSNGCNFFHLHPYLK